MSVRSTGLISWTMGLWLAALAGAAPAAGDVSPSIWVQQEQRRFGELLAKQPADVLVVPFQVQGHGLDPAERTLLATTVADHISATTALTVADPVLLGRALGEGSRTLATQDILAVGDQARARYILIGSAGHDGQGKLRIQLKLLSKDGTWKETSQRDWPNLALSDETPPYQTITKLFADIDSMLGAQSRPAASPKISVAPVTTLPTLASVIAAKGPAAQNLHVAQLLASLYPRFPEAGQERAWVQTLRLAHTVTNTDGKQLAIARALFHLGRRPAALAALGEPRNSAEHALREALNGNLPAATQHAQRIKDPVQRLIAQIELRDLRLAYGAANAEIEVESLSKLVPVNTEWHDLVYPRIQGEGSVWGVESTIQAYSRFSALFDPGAAPVETVRRVIEKFKKDPAAAELELGQIAFGQYDTLVRAQNVPARGIEPLMRWLMMDLYHAQVLTDLLGNIYVTLDARVSLDDANAELARYDGVLRGHPDFTAARARLAWREYARWRGQQRAQWQTHALRHSLDAFHHSNRLSRALEYTERQAASTPEIAAILDPVRTEYFWDWPISRTWVPANVREDRQAMQRYADALAKYAVTEYSTFSWVAQRPVLADRQKMLWQATENRFDGAPDLVQDRAGNFLSRFDFSSAEQVLRRYVDTRSLSIGPYQGYAQLLVAQGRHKEASQMLSTYPGFAEDSGENRVMLSNTAGDLAWLWWPIGQFEYAMPMFQRSAKYNTGSAYSLTSAAILTLDAGDPNGAANRYMQQARRYSDLNALDQYFQLIFALGRPEEAWRIYDEVYRDGNGGRVIASIVSGVRVLGWSDRRVLDWLLFEKNRVLADGTFFYAPPAAVAASIIDRDPQDLPAVVDAFKAPSPYEIDAQAGKIVGRGDPAVANRGQRPICGPSRYAGTVDTGLGSRTNIDSHLVYFAKGYQALHRGQSAEAFNAFDEAARLFEMYGHRCEDVRYLLPYLALTAATVKNSAALEAYLKNVAYVDRSFNYQLALGVLAAVNSQPAEAERYFEAALNRWTFDRYAPLPPDYVYADVLERLYKQTKVETYRERLVRWAKIRQRVAPADAWPYAKEYRYTRVAADQERALGMALYLDKQSVTLTGVSVQEAASAQTALAPNNQFLAWRKQGQGQKKAQSAPR
ncbi:MAG TPA: hypothetical protein VGD45_13130 [Steroidobacter sp.]|uniref:tetratricopeptide repeat protein n=1 Tax=Steroidobacter sp. TaxID=1978227 RepID=UPI002EDAE32C